MNIPLSRPEIGQAEKEAVLRVLDSGMLAQGPEVAQFESEFAGYVDDGASDVQAVACVNGTAAIELVLRGLGIGPSDEVILPSFTFIATANAVRTVGATPVFADVDERLFTLDPSDVEKRISPRTKAVIAVHLYGQPADLDGLGALGRSHGFTVIEDAAQAHGARWQGARVGSLNPATFSFYPTKNMTTGEGGMVTTTDLELADRMRLIRNHGMRGKYEFETFGLNLRMNDISAALGRVQLRDLERRNEARRANAEYLNATITSVLTPVVDPRAEHVFHQYTVLVDDRPALKAHLETLGVGSGIYYPVPCHRSRVYASEVTLPVTEMLVDRVLSLPIREGLTQSELDYISRAVNRS